MKLTNMQVWDTEHCLSKLTNLQRQLEHTKLKNKDLLDMKRLLLAILELEKFYQNHSTYRDRR